jgi:hypothetical protein
MNVIDEFVNTIVDESDRTINERMVRNQVHWAVSILLNRQNRRVYIGENSQIINYFGITFSGSNTGKSYSLKKVKKLLGMRNNRDMTLEDQYVEYFNQLKKGTPTVENVRYIKSTMAMLKESTRQGIHKSAESMAFASVKGGSLNIYSDEMFVDMSDSLMGMLLSGYDGNIPAPTIKGGEDEESYVDVEDLPINFIGSSSMEPLYRSNNVGDFISTLRGGWFRRAFVVNTANHRIVSKDIVKNIPKKSIELIHDDIEIGNFIMNKEAELVFNSMRKTMIDESGIIQYGDLRDPYKILSLASIYAYGDRRLEITAEDIMYAQQFEIQCFKDASIFCEMEHDFVRAFFELKNKEMSENELVRAKLLPATNKNNREGVIQDIDAYAIEHNAQLYKITRNHITYHKIRTYDNTEGEIKLSYADWNEVKGNGTPSYLKLFQGSLAMLNELLKKESIQLTQYVLKPENTTGFTNRTKDNILTTSLLVFDFDKGTLTGNDIATILKPYNYMMRKSKSWKNGNSKLHIYLPLKYELNLSHEEFKIMYENIAMKLLFTGHYDESMKKSVQPVYEVAGNRAIVNEGKLFDPRCCIDGSILAKYTADIYQNVNTNNRVLRYIETFIHELVPGVGREPKVNSFIWKFINETENKPSNDEMMEALNMIDGVIADREWTKANFKKFEKMINDNFN